MIRVALILALVILACSLPASAQTAASAPSTCLLLDRTHEVPEPFREIEALLSKSGVSVIQSDASLLSVASELPACQAVLLWQEYTSVAYSPAEIALLRGYVSRGGALVLVGNLPDWVARHKPAGPADYPLSRLAAAFGVTLAAADVRADLGKGRLVYLHCDAVLSYSKLSAEVAKAPAKGAARLLSAIPDLHPAPAPALRVIPPDKTFSVGPVRVLYPGNLAAQGDFLQSLLRRLLPALRDAYACDLEAPVVVTALPLPGSAGLSSPNFNLNLDASPSAVAYDLAKGLALSWYAPGGRPIGLPRWISIGFVNPVALRAVSQAGFQTEAQNILRIYRAEFRAADPRMDRIDLSVSPPQPLGDAYCGKDIYILETLEHDTGLNVVARLRKAVRVAHGAGWFEDSLDSDQAIQLLSLGIGRDAFPFFRSLGVTVEPLPLDFARFRLREQDLDKLLGTK